MTQRPTVMVSSTYFDLKQIRADLATFLEDDLGYTALLSESDSFPIDPDLGTIENCRRRVEQHADVLVLVVGGRYGYVDTSTDNSVTNIEYSTARAKSIPIYAFVDKRVLSLLPVWQQNPNAKFEGIVDNPRLFDFIGQIRSTDNLWMFEFERAQDIVTVIRNQFAYMMSRALHWDLRVRNNIDENLDGITGNALRLVLERPRFWEMRTFAELVNQHLSSAGVDRFWHGRGIAVGSGESLRDPMTTVQWVQDRLAEFGRLVQAVNAVMGDGLQVAMGAPGEPGNPQQLLQIAHLICDLYKQAVGLSQRVRRAHVDEEWSELMEAFADESGIIVDYIAGIGNAILESVNAFERDWSKGPDDPLNIALPLVLTFERTTSAFNQINMRLATMVQQRLDPNSC